jgi:predicted SprT family Zn-dependent metalloprotease
MEALGRAHLGRSLQEAGWGFRFDRAKRRMGACRWNARGDTKILSLSRYFCHAAGWAVMEDVARHEIAHALDVETRGHSDHGPTWKRWARACGADPTRLYEGKALAAVASRYAGRCPHCGAEQPFYRRPKRRYACRACCDRYEGGRYADRFRLVLYDRRTGTPVARVSAAGGS